MSVPHTVRIEFGSAFDMVDFVQVISDHLCRLIGLDEDTLGWVGVAVREAVVNAVKHGNKNDPAKKVVVEFTTSPSADPSEIAIRIEDEGEGFDPDTLADPLAPENLLKSSGRGIFLVRNFMQDVALRRVPGGGMEIRMVKRAARAAS
jgi:serine/threonine-protein kinase RsbW